MYTRLLCAGVLGIGMCAGLGAAEPDAKGDDAGYELRIFDVADLATEPTDYPAPMMTLNSPQTTGFVNAAGVTPASTVMRAADLTTLIHDRMLAAEFADPQTSIAEQNGQLVVMQHKSVHQKIAQFLSELRVTAKAQIVVKALLVPAAEIPATAVLDAAALAKILGPQGSAAAVAAPRVVCFNGQLSHARSGSTFNYLRDYDVAGAVYDPVIKSFLTGVALDLKVQHIEGDLYHYAIREVTANEVKIGNDADAWQVWLTNNRARLAEEALKKHEDAVAELKEK